MAKVFDGKELALEKQKTLTRQVAAFKKKYKLTPKLASILVGDNPAAKLYLSLKQKAAKKVGIDFIEKKFEDNESVDKIYHYIKRRNIDKETNGIMIQLPLPAKIDSFWLTSKIDPGKDVDCLTPENFGLLAMNKSIFLPATVKAILEIIKDRVVELEGCRVTIVGASDIVGKPLALHLSNLGATVTLCRSKTKILSRHTLKADILVSATGVPGLIKKNMVKNRAIVIDVGSPEGDVDFSEVEKVASFITPVPGGVGPLTVVCLLENVFQAARTLVGSRCR